MRRDDPTYPPAPVRRLTADLGWGRLVARVFLIVLPAQVVGVLLGGSVVTASDRLVESPLLSNLITVIAGAVVGVALGLLLRPEPRRRRLWLVVAAVVSAVVVVLLLVVATLRLPDGSPTAPWTAYLLGPVLLVAVQSAITWGLWEIRSRPW